MKTIKYLLIIFIFSNLVSSCQREYFKTPALDPNAQISFTRDLQPIFASKCAISGCHNKSVSPNLLKDDAYLSLFENGLVDTTFLVNPKLRAEDNTLMIKLNTNMPVGKLPLIDRNKFLLWLKQGAKLN